MKAADFYARFRSEASKAIVGQDDAVRLCALALIAQGHVLLEGVPGVGKTLLAKTIARLLSLQYGRSEEHTSELQSQSNLVCRLLLEKKKPALHTNSPGCHNRSRRRIVAASCPQRQANAYPCSDSPCACTSTRRENRQLTSPSSSLLF